MSENAQQVRLQDGGALRRLPLACVVPGPLQQPPSGTLVTGHNARPGLRVTRGRDWDKGTQDGVGIGTLLGPGDQPGWYSVQWDGAFGQHNSYRVGCGGQHDLAFGTEAAPSLRWPRHAPAATAPLGVGQAVLLSARARAGAKVEGALRPGQVGTVRSNSGYLMPYKVRAGAQQHAQASQAGL